MKIVLSIILALFLSACATRVDLTQTSVAKFTHADLQNAAAVATQAKQPTRAAVYTAVDTQLTQCETDLTNAEPTFPAGTVGAFTLNEIATEGLNTGLPLSCQIIPFPKGLLIVK